MCLQFHNPLCVWTSSEALEGARDFCRRVAFCFDRKTLSAHARYRDLHCTRVIMPISAWGKPPVRWGWQQEGAVKGKDKKISLLERRRIDGLHFLL